MHSEACRDLLELGGKPKLSKAIDHMRGGYPGETLDLLRGRRNDGKAHMPLRRMPLLHKPWDFNMSFLSAWAYQW